jgi:hypothetical protein
MSQPDSVAGEIRILVGAILLPGNVVVSEPGPDLISSQVDQGPDDFGYRRRANSAETGGASAAEEAVQYRFRLIVQRVAGGDGVTDSCGDLFREKIVSYPPSLLLDIPGQGLAFENVYRQSVLKRQRAREIFVAIRFRAPQTMIDVQHRGRNPKLSQHMQKENGIRAAR